MSEEVSVVAVLTGKSGAGEAVLAALLRCTEPSRKDPGCRFYMAHRDLGNPDRIVMIERWASVTLLEAHAATPHLDTLRAELEPLLAVPMEITVLSAVA